MPFINANNIDLYYEVRGAGKPLVLLMGLGSDHRSWDPHVVDFEKHFQCILVDNRGVGKSEKPLGPYTCAQMAKDTLALMDALNLEQVYLNGCSMGGAIAQELAILAPERIEKLVLTASFPQLDAYGIRLCENFENAYCNLNIEQFRMLANHVIYSRNYFNSHTSEISASEKQVDLLMPGYAFLAQASACKTHNTFDRLHKIQAPTLVYGAENDDFVPASLTKKMAELIPNGRVEIVKGRGHGFHFEIAPIYNEAVIQFLEEEK